MTRTMKDSGIEWIGQIPEDWNLMRLQFCLNEIKEKNLPVKSEQVLSLVKDKGVMPYEEKGNVGNVAKEDISEYKLAYPNTLILNSMNILIGSVGISKYFGCVSPVYYVFKETEMSDLRFINYICTTNEFQKELRRYAKGILEIRLRVSAQDIFKRIIAYPNKQEQIKIADFLDKKCSHIDSILEKTKASIDECKQLKQSVITQAVTKGIRPNRPMKDSGIEWIGQIPANWKVRKLKTLTTIISKGTTPTTIGKDIINDGNIRFIKAENIQNDKLQAEPLSTIDNETNKLLKRSQLKQNDILFVIAGATIGKVAIVEQDFLPANTNQAVSFVRLFNTENHKFVWYFLKSNYIKESLNILAVQSAQPNLSMEDLGNFYLGYPDNLEQTEIVSYLDEKCTEIDKLITKKEKLIKELETYKKSLIYEYVTGKKEVI